MLYMLKWLFFKFTDRHMKHPIVWLILSCSLWTAAGLAQEQTTEKKKPSWSQGLPERQATPDFRKPAAPVGQPTAEINEPEVDMPSAVDVAIDSELTPDFEMPAIEIQVAEPAADEAALEYQVYAASEASALNDYDWQLLEGEPVEIPKTLSFSYKEVWLEVSINPRGEVVKVQRISDRTGMVILNYASQALKNWRFSPPEAVGIDGVISKTMKIDLIPRS